MTTYPTRPEPTVRVTAVIGKNIMLNGNLGGREDILIDGRLEGQADLPDNRLTIGATGTVQGIVKAKEIVVYGSVQGNLEATERIEIKRGAKVVGDLRSSRIVMEDESYFKGNVDTLKPEAVKHEGPKPQPRPQAVHAAGSGADAQASLLPGGDSKP
jgi:cytoskeletal protein CcmA (bactofilin family)